MNGIPAKKQNGILTKILVLKGIFFLYSVSTAIYTFHKQLSILKSYNKKYSKFGNFTF